MPLKRSPSAPVASARGRVASLTRSRAEDDPDLTAARGDLAAAKIQQYIEKVVSTAPPLTRAQKSRLSALIGGAS